MVLWDFVHHLNYKFIKSQHFESKILLSSSGKKGGRGGFSGYIEASIDG
jgi:hypothetical protein